jgi:hypothetical protein
VDPRAGLDDMEERKFLILLGLELRPLSHPARSQSLSRLPDSMLHKDYYRKGSVEKKSLVVSLKGLDA